MSFKSLDEMLQHAADFAATMFNAKGEVEPMWIAETKQGDLFVIGGPMPDRDGKDAYAATIKKLFAEKQVMRCTFLCEAWMIRAKVDEGVPLSHRLGGSLASHPDREEVIHVIAEDKKRKISGQYYILRPEIGKAKLSEFKKVDYGEMGGRFAGMLT